MMQLTCSMSLRMEMSTGWPNSAKYATTSCFLPIYILHTKNDKIVLQLHNK